MLATGSLPDLLAAVCWQRRSRLDGMQACLARAVIKVSARLLKFCR